MYVKGFIDMSGGNLLLRPNSNLIMQGGDISLNGNLYAKNVSGGGGSGITIANPPETATFDSNSFAVVSPNPAYSTGSGVGVSLQGTTMQFTPITVNNMGSDANGYGIVSTITNQQATFSTTNVNINGNLNVGSNLTIGCVNLTSAGAALQLANITVTSNVSPLLTDANGCYIVTPGQGQNTALFSSTSLALTGNLTVGTATAGTNAFVVVGNTALTGNTALMGNVGIGKTTPQYALDVSGAIQSSNPSTGTFNNFYGKVPPTSQFPSTVSPNTTNATSSTWVNNNVTWNASQSSAAAEINGNTFYPYNSNITSGNIWTSLNNYSLSSPYNSTTGAKTNIYSIGTVIGEWTQIQSSVPLSIYSYQVACGSNINRAPSNFYIVGSNDGSTWFPIQYVVTTAATNPYTTTFSYPSANPNILANNQYPGTSYGGSSAITTTTYGSYTTQPYTYFRMITTNIYSGGTQAWVDIAEWNITFNPSTSTGPSRTLLYMDASNVNQLDVSGSLALVNSNTSSMVVRPNAVAASSNAWQNNNVTWSSSSSSFNSSGQQAYNLFNTNNADNGWVNGSSAYSNSSPYNYTAGTYATVIQNINSGIGVSGEWIQLQSSIPVVMNNYSFYQSSAQAPATYYICGSNDGSNNWYPLIKAVATQVTGQTSVYTIPSGATSTSGTVSNITYNSYGYGSNAYTYFRLVITNLTSCTDGRAFFYEWTPAFTPATTSSVSLALDNAVPNQLNIGGSLGIAGGITPLYSTPSFGPGQVGQVLQGTIPSTWGGSAINAGIAITPGVWLITFYIYCTNGANNYFVAIPTNVQYTTSSVASYSAYPCSGTYIYTATSPITIYLYSYTNAVTCTVSYSYHTAVRIA